MSAKDIYTYTEGPRPAGDGERSLTAKRVAFGEGCVLLIEESENPKAWIQSSGFEDLDDMR